LLGDSSSMSACQAETDDTDRLGDQSMNDALTSLERALQILDDCDAPPHIGARLQEIINLVADDVEPVAKHKGNRQA